MVLLGVYLATLAPGVTIWDAGEFVSAIRSLGVPHPPGTPLYILVGHVWTSLLGVVPVAYATNLLSAVATAAACALLGGAFAGWLHSAAAGAAAGIAAGGMSTVWLSATETEVYSLALLLSIVALRVGNRAGMQSSSRHRLLLAYLIALSVPLHLSALVAMPAAILLAGMPARSDRPVWTAMLIPMGVLLIAMGAGTVSAESASAGIALVMLGAWLSSTESDGQRWGTALAALAVTGVAVTAVLFMLVRARHDPFINQGFPATWDALLQVVGRRQYDVPPLWPRRAPLWLQVGNLIQYADWQVALGLDATEGGSWRRTPLTLVFVALGMIGSLRHRALDRRSWLGVLALLGAASLGVVLVLNLRAGPSYGYGVLPEGALHEARERDYFFALAFAVGAAWSGIGAWSLAARLGRRVAWSGALVAMIPLATNWRVTDRSAEPSASLPERFGQALLASVPTDGVMFVAGDNDTYLSWHQQASRAHRRDVTIVTLPLLPATWYRAELARRHGLWPTESVSTWPGTEGAARLIAKQAAGLGRPLVMDVAVRAALRGEVGGYWSFRGMVYERRAAPDVEASTPDSAMQLSDRVVLDRQHTEEVARLIRVGAAEVAGRWSTDPTSRYLQALMQCPESALLASIRNDDAHMRLLDSRCNLR